MEFLENVEVNEPINVVIMIMAIFCLGYIVYFYFSKESKDERGLAILGRSSFFAVLIYFIYFEFITTIVHWVTIDEGMFQFVINSTFVMLLLPLCLLIMYFKKRI